jgi:DNA-binding NarL/FixJ family response regulator
VKKKKAQRRRVEVCLLAQHPVVAGEFRRLVGEKRFAVRIHALEPTAMGKPALERLAPADVFVIDASAARPANESLVAALLERFPEARLVVVADEFQDTTAFPLLRLGVKALVTYDQARGRLRYAVDAVSRGGYWVPRTLLGGFVESLLRDAGRHRPAHSAAGLSPREQQVLAALLDNLSNKEIASRLNISERTAKFHVSNLLAKFAVRRRADLILLHYHGPGA